MKKDYFEEEEITSWTDFEEKISNDLEKEKNWRRESYSGIQWLYRGQSDAKWQLQSTLKRHQKSKKKRSKITWKEYHYVLRAIKTTVESYLEKTINFPEDFEERTSPGPPPGYEFMIYTRHHGFPSPLLDWSRSPYVALFLL